MESLTNVKTGVLTTTGVVGSILLSFLGGWDIALQTLCIFMIVDYLLGLVVAGVYKKSPKSETGGLNSYAGWKGIVKKAITLLLVLLGHQVDLLLGIDYVRNGIIVALIVDEGISIAESYGLTGKKMPEALINALDLLKKEEVK